MNQQYLITITVSPDLEENLVDWLLEVESHTGFSSFPMHGHSSQPENLTLAEQVSGRKQQVRFQIHLPAAELEHFVGKLKEDLRGTGLHYWVSPVIESGHI